MCCFFFGQFRMYVLHLVILMLTLSCVPSPPPHSCQPFPRSLPTSMSFCFVLWSIEFNGFGANLGAYRAHNWRQWLPLLRNPSVQQGGAGPVSVLSSHWSPERESFAPCRSKVLRTGDHVTVCTCSVRCPVCRSGIFCCTWVYFVQI